MEKHWRRDAGPLPRDGILLWAHQQPENALSNAASRSDASPVVTGADVAGSCHAAPSRLRLHATGFTDCLSRGLGSSEGPAIGWNGTKGLMMLSGGMVGGFQPAESMRLSEREPMN